MSTRTASDREMTVFPDVMEEANIAAGKTVLYDQGVTSQKNGKVLQADGMKKGVKRLCFGLFQGYFCHVTISGKTADVGNLSAQ